MESISRISGMLETGLYALDSITVHLKPLTVIKLQLVTSPSKLLEMPVPPAKYDGTSLPHSLKLS